LLVNRIDENPILKPVRSHPWEAEAVFNGCPVRGNDGRVYLLYRALSTPHYQAPNKGFQRVSSIGVAVSEDGLRFHDRRLFLSPQEDWDAFGCEDPRVTCLDGTYFVFYTALSKYPPTADEIRVGVAVTKDFEKVEKRSLVTPFNAKGMALFPERIGGKAWAVLTVHTDKPPAHICLASFEKVEDLWDRTYWDGWYRDLEKASLPLLRSPEDHIEVGAPPVKTELGWLLFYSYIQNYFNENRRLFTVEAVLLDLENPSKVVARTKYPLLVPEEYYEKFGQVANIVFPSGALTLKDGLHLYYGAADTTCCAAHVDLKSLLVGLLQQTSKPKFERAKENPILVPERAWEKKAVFNPAAIRLSDRVHIVYRAMSEDDTSVLGYAWSKDGIHIDYRDPEPIYVPREPFEQKQQPGFSGCEDPRLTLIGDRIFMCYTAFDAKTPPGVALSSIEVDDFLAKRWNWSTPIRISPPGVDDKDACVFPEKVKDPVTGEERFLIIHRINPNIDYALARTLDFKTQLEENQWIRPRKGSWDCVKVGLSSPPIKTEKGWILLYHGVDEASVYRVGAVLLSLENPLEVVSRTDEPIFEPEEAYEREGMVKNVVFPCGTVEMDGRIFCYYGGADSVVGVATLETDKLLGALLLTR